MPNTALPPTAQRDVNQGYPKVVFQCKVMVSLLVSSALPVKLGTKALETLSDTPQQYSTLVAVTSQSGMSDMSPYFRRVASRFFMIVSKETSCYLLIFGYVASVNTHPTDTLTRDVAALRGMPRSNRVCKGERSKHTRRCICIQSAAVFTCFAVCPTSNMAAGRQHAK